MITFFYVLAAIAMLVGVLMILKGTNKSEKKYSVIGMACIGCSIMLVIFTFVSFLTRLLLVAIVLATIAVILLVMALVTKNKKLIVWGAVSGLVVVLEFLGTMSFITNM